MHNDINQIYVCEINIRIQKWLFINYQSVKLVVEPFEPAVAAQPCNTRIFLLITEKSSNKIIITYISLKGKNNKIFLIFPVSIDYFFMVVKILKTFVVGMLLFFVTTFISQTCSTFLSEQTTSSEIKILASYYTRQYAQGTKTLCWALNVLYKKRKVFTTLSLRLFLNSLR